MSNAFFQGEEKICRGGSPHSSHIFTNGDVSCVSLAMFQSLPNDVLLATPARMWSRSNPTTRWIDYTSDLAWSRVGVEPT